MKHLVNWNMDNFKFNFLSRLAEIVLIIMATVMNRKYFLSSVAVDSEDGNGLKLEKNGQLFFPV